MKSQQIVFSEQKGPNISGTTKTKLKKGGVGGWPLRNFPKISRFVFESIPSSISISHMSICASLLCNQQLVSLPFPLLEVLCWRLEAAVTPRLPSMNNIQDKISIIFPNFSSNGDHIYLDPAEHHLPCKGKEGWTFLHVTDQAPDSWGEVSQYHQ